MTRVTPESIEAKAQKIAEWLAPSRCQSARTIANHVGGIHSVAEALAFLMESGVVVEVIEDGNRRYRLADVKENFTHPRMYLPEAPRRDWSQ